MHTWLDIWKDNIMNLKTIYDKLIFSHNEDKQI